MFTPGGQVDLHHVAAYGGKGGGGSQQYTPPPPPPPIPATTLTDPVSGKSFSHVNDPNSPDYQPGARSAADLLNEEITQRQAGEKATSDQAAADKAAKEAQAQSNFQTSRQSAYDNALQGVIRKFQLQGADPSQYMQSDITPALQRQYNSVQNLDPNPTAAFDPSLGDTIIGDVLSGKRTQASNAFNSIFSPTYAQDVLPDSITDQYKGTILNEQFDPLEAQLQNAQKRGTLGGAGYAAAEDRLRQKRSVADTNLSTLGSSILAADRSGINDYITGARGDVSNLSLTSNFDPNTYSSAAKGKVNTATSGFGGALRNAVGDTKFADISDLLNAGGAVQGSQNPNATNPTGSPTTAIGGGPLSPAYISEDELAKRGRGLGSTGAF